MLRPLLLHICCGPCTIMPVRVLREDGFEPVGWFTNPNIQPLSEYLHRREVAEDCAKRLGIKIYFYDKWELAEWLDRQMALGQSKERCERCCGERIEATAKAALQLGYSAFSTTLLYSRYQPHEFIRKKGIALAISLGLDFIYRDFRVYWHDGINISKEWGIYRQPYCGCIFSEAERYSKKLARLQKNLGFPDCRS